MSDNSYVSIQDRIKELEKRGVNIDLKQGVRKWNNFICSTNFTRICGYAKTLKAKNKGTVTIEEIKNAYYFDSELSHLISKIVLYIETYLRTQIVDSLCLQSMFDNHAKTPHLNCELFYDEKDQKEWWGKVEEEIIQRTRTSDKDDYLTYCIKEYGTTDKMPIWAIVEFISLDKMLALLNKIKNKDTYKKLSPILGVDQRQVHKWLLCFKDLRNAIFHNTVLRNINIKFPQGDTPPEDIKNKDKWDDYLNPILKVISNADIFPEEVRKIGKEVTELLKHQY